jgi:hypothetical protein
MANIRIACLTGKTNQAGITSWYWQPSATLARAGWRPLTLGKDEGAAIAAARARNAEVDLWKAGGGKPGEVKRRVETGTLSSLIARYRREVIDGRQPNGAPLLRTKTKDNYETSLRRIEAWAGKHPLVYITPARVRTLRDTIARPGSAGGLGHATAFNLLRVLRQLFAFAESIDLIAKGSNPAAHFKLPAPPPRPNIWEADDEAAFIAAAYALGYPSMALAAELALYTAQREADLIAMTEAQLAPLPILDPLLRARLADQQDVVMGWQFTQGKGDTPMGIPLEPQILARVQAALRTNRAKDRAATPQRLLTHVLVNDNTSLPWKIRHFITTWRKIVAHAAKATNRPQMLKLVWHDWRRTRVVRLRRIGMNPAMIASITGHSPKSIDMMLKVYGPIDINITAAGIVASLPPLAAVAAAQNHSNKSA